MTQYCPARAEEDEQGNVHEDESEDAMEEEEENEEDEIMGEVNERIIDNILPRVTFLRLRVQHNHHRHQNLLLIINFVIINSFGDASLEISWQHKTWINFYKGHREGKELSSHHQK